MSAPWSRRKLWFPLREAKAFGAGDEELRDLVEDGETVEHGASRLHSGASVGEGPRRGVVGCLPEGPMRRPPVPVAGSGITGSANFGPARHVHPHAT